ncbi:MAG: hypothetical protein ABT20_17205 [Rubrivivax sp. SCN 70-15]|nr:MAG: hypothetical protein ABT20_17205 [Rubrivivax sp. SCN 70-15]
MRWQLAAGAAAFAGYALASNWLMVHAPAHAWTVALLFGPLLLGLAADGWRRRHRATLALAAVLAAVLAVLVARGGVAGVARLYVLQHALIHAALAWTFGITLRPGATPLISALAARLHERFTPAMRDYTRRLTALWTTYFIAMIAISLVLYALAPWAVWSWFANLVTPLAAAAFFVGEHLLRRWRHPDFERVSLAAAVQAWRSPGAAEPR